MFNVYKNVLLLYKWKCIVFEEPNKYIIAIVI